MRNRLTYCQNQMQGKTFRSRHLMEAKVFVKSFLLDKENLCKDTSQTGTNLKKVKYYNRGSVSIVFSPFLFLIGDDRRPNVHSVGHHLEQFQHRQVSRDHSFPQGCPRHHQSVFSASFRLVFKNSVRKNAAPKHRWQRLLPKALQETEKEKWEDSALRLVLTANVGRVDSIDQIGTAHNRNDGNCCVDRTENRTQYGKLTTQVAGKPLHESHTDTPGRIFVVGTLKHQQWLTPLFKIHFVAVVGFDPVYSITQDAWKDPIQDDWLKYGPVSTKEGRNYFGYFPELTSNLSRDRATSMFSSWPELAPKSLHNLVTTPSRRTSILEDTSASTGRLEWEVPFWSTNDSSVGACLRSRFIKKPWGSSCSDNKFYHPNVGCAQNQGLVKQESRASAVDPVGKKSAAWKRQSIPYGPQVSTETSSRQIRQWKCLGFPAVRVGSLTKKRISLSFALASYILKYFLLKTFRLLIDSSPLVFVAVSAHLALLATPRPSISRVSFNSVNITETMCISKQNAPYWIRKDTSCPGGDQTTVTFCLHS